MQVCKWGNSLAIRLPAAIVEDLKLKAGDELDIRPGMPGEFTIRRKMTREEAIAALRTAGFRLPKGYKFNREEAHAR